MYEEKYCKNSHQLGDCREVKLHWHTIHGIKKKIENKINADHLHCGGKRLNRGQHRPKSQLARILMLLNRGQSDVGAKCAEMKVSNMCHMF